MSNDLSSATHDVVIVGAGVAGALVAWSLAESGVRTLVLEAGPERPDRIELVGAYATAAAKVPSAPYAGTVGDAQAPYPRVTDGKQDGHYVQAGPDWFNCTYERLVGGSTWHWLGNVPRFLPSDFQLASTYGVGTDWPLTYDDLEPWYVRAEHELGVSGDDSEWSGVFGAWRSADFPMTHIWPAYGDSVVAKALDEQTFRGIKIRIRTTPQARNSRPYQGRPPCAGNSSWVPICPIAAKYDATVHIRKAQEPTRPGSRSAEIQGRSVVKRLVADPTSGRIVRALYERWTPDGSSREEHEATGRIYVLAAHAIETPLILLESGLSKSGPVGRNLMDHLQGYGGAILPKPVYPFRGPPVTSGIDEFRDGEFRREHAAFRISIGNDGWGRMESLEELVRQRIFDDGLLGPALRSAVRDRATRMLRMSYSTEMLPDQANRVEVGGYDSCGNPRPRIHFHLADYNRSAFQAAVDLFGQFFARLKATETVFSFPAKDYSGAGHIMGTCRMGTSAPASVVDSECRAHEHPNLYIVGASTFPTSGTANPTLTVAALALRAADSILSDLNGTSA